MTAFSPPSALASAFALLIACTFGAATPLQAQSPSNAHLSEHAAAAIGVGMWAPAPKPHLVIRPPIDPHASHHHKKATIPFAVAEPVWKQPYAYGYFGVKPRRLPYRSFGHQQAFTEWRIR